ILSLVVAVVTLGFAVAMKFSVESMATREFRAARDAGDAAFGEENHFAALENYEKALAKRDDDAARLGRARALCALAKNGELKQASGDREVVAQHARALRTDDVESVYARARADIDVVAQHRPEDALALFYRGFLRWRSKDPVQRNA